MNANLRRGVCFIHEMRIRCRKEGRTRGSGMIKSVARQEAMLPNLLSRGYIYQGSDAAIFASLIPKVLSIFLLKNRNYIVD